MKKIRVGITGQKGFLGSHLWNFLGLQPSISLIPFERLFFNDSDKLKKFVSDCDVIIHLAAINRHHSLEELYQTNIELVTKLIAACEATESKPHMVFSSSTQEYKSNHYGKSKLEGKRLFFEWASKSGSKVTSLTIPNIFGPFGKPNYNSVVATFCYKLTHEEQPEIIKDGELNLIYVNELTREIYSVIVNNKQIDKVRNNCYEYVVSHTSSHKVSEILGLLEEYKNEYYIKGIIPPLSKPFERGMFNTFRSYIPYKNYPVLYQKHSDNRGGFVEIARTNTPGQTSYSTTKQGVVRGNHFHTRKVERFAVIKGKARIQLRKINSDKVISYELDGVNPAYVDIPIWHTHNIANIGNEELLTLFWIDEPFDPSNSDTYFEEV